jgi:hypothetical protein
MVRSRDEKLAYFAKLKDLIETYCSSPFPSPLLPSVARSETVFDRRRTIDVSGRACGSVSRRRRKGVDSIKQMY